jgi:hypothetical protein
METSEVDFLPIYKRSIEMDMNKRDLASALVALDIKRKDDLICSLVDAIFDMEYDYDFDQMDNIIEVIENISGIDNLQVLMHE